MYLRSPPSLPVKCQGRVRLGRFVGVVDRTARTDWLVRNIISIRDSGTERSMDGTVAEGGELG